MSSAVQKPVFDLGNIKQAVQEPDSTICKTYKDLNPTLCVSPIYSVISGVPEYARVAATRVRLSSHNLKIETGRWSRLPRENQTCTCGAVQTVLKCPRTWSKTAYSRIDKCQYN